MATLAHHFEEGGWGMYPVLACMVVLGMLTIERALVLYWPRAPGDAVLERVAWHVRVGDVAGALTVATSTEGAPARIARVALRHSLLPVPALESAIDAQVKEEVARLRRGLPLLHPLMGVATLWGLLGTVTGLGYQGFGPANADAASRATMLARSVSEAMNCTALGLLAALLAVGASTLLHGEADRIASELNSTAQSIRNLLVESRDVLRLHGARPAITRATYRAATSS